MLCDHQTDAMDYLDLVLQLEIISSVFNNCNDASLAVETGRMTGMAQPVLPYLVGSVAKDEHQHTQIKEEKCNFWRSW